MTKFCIFVRFESRFVRFVSEISEIFCNFAADFDIHMHMVRRIHTIAMSGFASEQAFYRIFKEITGLTPLQYRHKNEQ